MRKILAGILALALLLCSVAGFAESETEYQELATGSKGEEVRLLQERLKELGYYTISVDGDYGKGTVGAVSGFQGRNGLEATGIADIETQKLLYSDEALSAPATPNVEITKVTKDGSIVSFTVRNNLDETIDQFVYRMITYNANGRIDGYSHGKIDEMDEDVYRWRWTENVTIKPHKTRDISYTYPDQHMAIFFTVGVAVDSYHVASGETYEYSYEQMTFKKSDGSMLYPTEDNTKFRILTDEELDQLEQEPVSLGYEGMLIPFYASKYYQKPTGWYITKIEEGNMAERAGLKVGDVVISYDDDGSTQVNAGSYAKLKLLAGEDVNVTYWRNGETYTTIFSLDEEKMAGLKAEDEEEEEQETFSVADELIKLADLLDKGIITQEEFDAQKAKLLAE